MSEVKKDDVDNPASEEVNPTQDESSASVSVEEPVKPEVAEKAEATPKEFPSPRKKDSGTGMVFVIAVLALLIAIGGIVKGSGGDNGDSGKLSYLYNQVQSMKNGSETAVALEKESLVLQVKKAKLILPESEHAMLDKVLSVLNGTDVSQVNEAMQAGAMSASKSSAVMNSASTMGVVEPEAAAPVVPEADNNNNSAAEPF